MEMCGHGCEIYGITVTLRKFSFFQNYLKFDDKTIGQERKTTDNLATTSTLLKIFVSKCQAIYRPFEYMSI